MKKFVIFAVMCLVACAAMAQRVVPAGRIGISINDASACRNFLNMHHLDTLVSQVYGKSNGQTSLRVFRKVYLENGKLCAKNDTTIWMNVVSEGQKVPEEVGVDFLLNKNHKVVYDRNFDYTGKARYHWDLVAQGGGAFLGKSGNTPVGMIGVEGYIRRWMGGVALGLQRSEYARTSEVLGKYPSYFGVLKAGYKLWDSKNKHHYLMVGCFAGFGLNRTDGQGSMASSALLGFTGGGFVRAGVSVSRRWTLLGEAGYEQYPRVTHNAFDTGYQSNTRQGNHGPYVTAGVAFTLSK